MRNESLPASFFLTRYETNRFGDEAIVVDLHILHFSHYADLILFRGVNPLLQLVEGSHRHVHQPFLQKGEPISDKVIIFELWQSFSAFLILKTKDM